MKKTHAILAAFLGLMPLAVSAQVAGMGLFTNSAGGFSSGSSGDVQFNNSGVLGGSSLFNWDNTTNRLRIGTASTASATLHVNGGSVVNLISTTATGTFPVDFASADAYRLRLTGNTVLSPTNVPPAGVYAEKRIKVMQSATVSYTLTFPSNVMWSYGASPTTIPSASTVNTFVLGTDDGGVTYEGYWTGAFMK